MTQLSTSTLPVPGATLRYDVRGDLGGPDPVLVMIASPMDASGFGTLASYFTDRTVVTYDPRGVSRSERDASGECSPQEHADDVHRLIAALDAGPVDLFASSGGAVNALALLTRHPEQVRTLVAHEPPLAELLPDADQVRAAVTNVCQTYQAAGWGPAMAKFIALTARTGELPATYADEPAPSPADFGLPAEDDGTRDDVMFGQNLRALTTYRPDFEVLGGVATRIVVGAGEDSAGQIAHRAALAVADRLGTTAVLFPGDHDGFLGGEFGMQGQPEAFAATLRRVLGYDEGGAAP